jgi:hypothetical protein
MTFRPTLTDGLALSRIKISKPPKEHKKPLGGIVSAFSRYPFSPFPPEGLGYERQLVSI